MGHPVSSLVNPKDAQALKMRARKLLLAAGVLMVCVGLGWTLFFLQKGSLLVSGFELLLAFMGACVFGLAHAKHYRVAAGLLFGSLFIALCAFSLWLDVASSAAPRSSHINLLTVGLCAYYVFQAEKAWLRYCVVGLFLSAFLFFASTHFAFHTPYAMPDSVRVVGTWINTVCALLVLVLTLYLMNTDQSARSTQHTAMRDALAARHFTLFYQPQVAADGSVVGAEALMRWRDPQRGLIPPGEFIPIAEQTGFILALGQWALGAACEQLAQWQGRVETRHLSLSVNVSAQQIRQPDFVAIVKSAVQRTGAPAHLLKLELTESVLVHDIEDLIRKMQALHGDGIGFSLDDFGTGYSSLNYLKRLPLSQLKIDQSFVHDVAANSNAATIAGTLVSLGRSLNLSVIAEGVETAQQRDFLLRQGCLVFQGYLFSRPLPVEQFEAYLAGGHDRPAVAARDEAGRAAGQRLSPLSQA